MGFFIVECSVCQTEFSRLVPEYPNREIHVHSIYLQRVISVYPWHGRERPNSSHLGARALIARGTFVFADR